MKKKPANLASKKSQAVPTLSAGNLINVQPHKPKPSIEIIFKGIMLFTFAQPKEESDRGRCMVAFLRPEQNHPLQISYTTGFTLFGKPIMHNVNKSEIAEDIAFLTTSTQNSNSPNAGVPVTRWLDNQNRQQIPFDIKRGAVSLLQPFTENLPDFESSKMHGPLSDIGATTIPSNVGNRLYINGGTFYRKELRKDKQGNNLSVTFNVPGKNIISQFVAQTIGCGFLLEQNQFATLYWGGGSKVFEHQPGITHKIVIDTLCYDQPTTTEQPNDFQRYYKILDVNPGLHISLSSPPSSSFVPCDPAMLGITTSEEFNSGVV